MGKRWRGLAAEEYIRIGTLKTSETKEIMIEEVNKLLLRLTCTLAMLPSADELGKDEPKLDFCVIFILSKH